MPWGPIRGRVFLTTRPGTPGNVPADIPDYIEWPTFVLFFCGC